MNILRKMRMRMMLRRRRRMMLDDEKQSIKKNKSTPQYSFKAEETLAGNSQFWWIEIEFRHKTWGLDTYFCSTPEISTYTDTIRHLYKPVVFLNHDHQMANQRAGQIYSRTCLKAFPTWQPHPGLYGRDASFPTPTTTNWKTKAPWNLWNQGMPP